jgi:hypothetical protein
LEGAFAVIKAKRPEKKMHSAVGIGRYVIQIVARPRKIETLLRKEKHGTTFARLKHNLVSKKMLTDVRPMKSDSFFRSTITARADFASTLANIQQYYRGLDTFWRQPRCLS